MAARVCCLVLAVLATACATVKPCPPCPAAEVTQVQISVATPPPQPPPLEEPASELTYLEPDAAPVDVLIRALLLDRERYLRALREALKALEVYRVK